MNKEQNDLIFDLDVLFDKLRKVRPELVNMIKADIILRINKYKESENE